MSKRIIVALDFSERQALFNLVTQLDPKACRLKVGKELFTRFGPAIVSELQKEGFEIFLDLKFHDIPNTVAAACKAAADLGVWMLNVHALGGRAMLQAAVNVLTAYGQDKPLLVAVTVLTSLTNTDLSDLGFHNTAIKQVLLLAELAHHAKLDGVVCSPQEAALLKQHFAPSFILVTPGVRLNNDSQDDQQRIMTPVQAIKNGADYLVIGRSITQSANPLATINQISLDIQE